MGINGFFGSIQGPFAENQQLFTKIEDQCNTTIDYISKIGIHYVGDFDLDINGNYWPQLIVKINNIEFQIGKTRMLELEDVQITSIQFNKNTNNLVYIDYQYSQSEEK